MDTKKWLAVIVVAVLAVAAVGIYFLWEKDDDSLKVVYLNKGGYETIMVAQDKGFFNELDYDVEHLQVSGSGQDAVNALLAGSADIAVTGDGPAINTLHAYGDDVVILCSYNIDVGGHVWVAKPGSGISDSNDKQTVADSMKGKKAGVIEGSTTQSIFNRWCAAYGLSTAGGGDGLSIQKFTDGNALLAAFAAGTIDVLAASEPYPTTAISHGGYKVGSSADINVNAVCVLMTTKAKYDANEQKMKDFVTAMYKATDYMNDNRDECIQLCSSKIGWSVADQTSAFDRTTFKVSFDDLVLASLFAAASAKSYSELTEAALTASCPLKPYLDTLA